MYYNIRFACKELDSLESPVLGKLSLDWSTCAESGSFEEPQIAYLARHNKSGQARWIPRVSHDAKEGTQSAILNTGSTTLAPILSTATVAHRFVCFVKADKRVEVTMQLAGEHRKVQVGTEWTKVDMDLTPPLDLMGRIPASITIPAGATVWLDAVSFQPVPAGERK